MLNPPKTIPSRVEPSRRVSSVVVKEYKCAIVSMATEIIEISNPSRKLPAEESVVIFIWILLILLSSIALNIVDIL